MVFIRPVCAPAYNNRYSDALAPGTSAPSRLQLFGKVSPPLALSHAKADFSTTLRFLAVSGLTDDRREDTGRHLWRGERGVLLAKSGSLRGSRFFKCMTSWLLFAQKMQEAEEILSSWQMAPSQLSSRA